MLKRIPMMVFIFSVIVTIIYVVASFTNYDVWYRGFTKMELLRFSFEDYFAYLKLIITDFSFGKNLINNKEILDLVLEEIPTTFKINMIAFIFYVTFGVFFGVLTAYYNGTWIDKVISYMSLLLGSVPGFVLILALMYYFGLVLGWLPFRYDSSPENPYTFVQSLTLPVIALSAAPIAQITRILRAEILETMNSEFLLLCRAKGLNKRQILLRHDLKNSIIPLISQIPHIFSVVLTMSFIVEITYDIHGAARLLYDSFIFPTMDYIVIMVNVEVAFVVSVFYVGISLIMYFLFDLLYFIIDPRIKIGSRKTIVK